MNALILVIVLSANIALALPHEAGLAPVPRIFDLETRSGGGFASGQTSEEALPGIEKRAPVYETDAPPGTAWQNLQDGYVWDNEDNKKDRVIKAWRNAKALAAAAKASLDVLIPGNNPSAQLQDELALCFGDKNSRPYLNCLRQTIARSNPAYTQLFGADPENIGIISQNLGKLLDNVEKVNADQRNNHLLYFTYGDRGTDSASNTNNCDNGIYAFVLLASQLTQLTKNGGGGAPPAGSYIIHFCPPFFQQDRMEDQLYQLSTASRSDLADVQNKICNLNNLDSTARIMLHELTHLPWTLNTNDPTDRSGPYKDKTGWIFASSGSTLFTNPLQQLQTKSFSSKNADSYAWFGVYNYFNNVDKCQGIMYTGHAPSPANAAKCTDVWPNTERKYTKDMWDNYPTGNN